MFDMICYINIKLYNYIYIFIFFNIIRLRLILHTVPKTDTADTQKHSPCHCLPLSDGMLSTAAAALHPQPP